ncbi:MAG TPA: CAP domain-containing protein [Fimbriimonadaceae bacterium]|nr:CAP domain-containing protein [Fimbriimonadaceae bacterium]
MGRIGYGFRRRFCLLPCFIVTFSLGSNTSLDLYFKSYGPKGTILIKNPTLTWECWADDPKMIQSVEAELDGKPIQATYDPNLRKVIASTGVLAAGAYQVAMRVRYPGGGVHEKSWKLQVSDRALDNLPAPDDAQREALAAANDVRAGMGLEPYSMDDRINAAGKAHAKYLEQNKMTGHVQREGTPGFFGKTHKERLEAFGFVGNAVENVAYGAVDAKEAIQSLIDAPYHRLAFLQPGKLEFGSGLAGKCLTMACSLSEREQTVVYPGDGQKGIPTYWNKPEVPDPLAIHGASGRKVGYVITFAHFMPSKARLQVDEATLKSADGTLVDTYVNTPANDKNLEQACFLIPQGPLKPNTTYTASVKGVVDTDEGPERVSKTWQFTTGAK